jgi:hypothetical protein
MKNILALLFLTQNMDLKFQLIDQESLSGGCAEKSITIVKIKI